MDSLSRLLARFNFSARVFYNAPFCGSNAFRDEGKSGQLHLLRSGRLRIHHSERAPLELAVPTLVFYPRGLAHVLEVPQGEQAQLLCAEVTFEGGCQSPLAKALPECVHWPLATDRGSARLLEALFEEAEERQGGQQIVLDRLCEALIALVLRSAVDRGMIAPGWLAGLSDPGLGRTLVAMHEAPGHAWTLSMMAAHSNMSRSKFALRFREVVGVTPAEYLLTLRLGVARKLLLRALPVSAVAQRVGYASASAFTRAFTAKYGVAPGTWVLRLQDRGEADVKEPDPRTPPHPQHHLLLEQAAHAA